ncbi:ammonium transporter [Ureibacillus sp. FSL K6-8385]|uniref:Ammonium transporter n=1 Tax=Ureibacillus terrenus TaxID=118246 RepID=A0A540V515_9BACL|nr:ammonium transporter [Ureibacillus terrenus]MED3662626.1 ammonium transporter [Ureibacillus terrenus]MED3764922.1 ammonium transporter [Ureibacillus terrenus]TQE91847.1 ammonium transporter [Ureibacillus terrenus]
MLKKIGSIIPLLLLVALPAYAAEPTVESLELSVNLVWVMLGAILVFFMHAGFTLVETGFTRAKNSLNIIMKNFLTISLVSILYYLVGFGLMFGDSAGGVVGTNGFFLSGREDIDFFIFQAMFAATSITIISGAVAERIHILSYMLIAIGMSIVIYPIIGHWVWSGDGWLAQLGFTDFAGSTVVHLTGGIAALTVVIFLGPRIGKYTGKKVNVIPGHNIPLGALGVFVLWLGWFGFNGASTLAADTSLVPNVIATTLLSTSAAFVASALYTRIRFGKIDPSISLNGVLGGLVGITAGAADISIPGSIVVGLVSGILLVEGVRFLDAKLRVDDPVGAIAVHGICGIWGTLAVGLFSTSSGLFYGAGASQLGIQALGVLAVLVYTFLLVSVITVVINYIYPIRVSSEEEIAGLDYSEHGAYAYEWSQSLLERVINGNEEKPVHGLGLADRLNNLARGTVNSKTS